MDKYTIKIGDTIDEIAKRFNLTINDLQVVNDTNLYELKEGDTINIPLILSKDFDYYEVKEGNSLYQISKQLNTNINTLSSLNGLEINDYIYPKQVLIVPKKNVKVYITQIGDTIRDLENNLGFNIDYILEDNPSIYLVENQLIIEREK